MNKKNNQTVFLHLLHANNEKQTKKNKETSNE